MLNEEICSMGEDDSILNGKLLLHQLDQTFVLLINNPENEISSWNEFLQQTNIDKANEGIIDFSHFSPIDQLSFI